MKKTILAIFMALIFVVACGEDSKGVGKAKITVNGVSFDNSVTCSATPADKLTLSIGATDKDGNTISIGSVISKDGENYKYMNDDGFNVNYSEQMKEYTATEDGGGTFSASFKNGIVKASFNVTGKLNGFGEEKQLKGEVECTPGGATN